MRSFAIKDLYRFYARHGFNPEIDIDEAVRLLLDDMEKGLGEDFQTASSMDMIPLWKTLPRGLPKNRRVIVIDAGGTNFRTCLVTFDESGTPRISEFYKHPMPAIDREMTNEEFFGCIAAYLEPLKDKADTISFCFSFAVKIDPDGGGEAIKLSKEIKLPQIASCKINEGLKAALIKNGWQTVKKVLMVNDTAAVLQAGMLFGQSGAHGFDSNIGFVLGTGLNSAYIEEAPIEKLKTTAFYGKPQIIVCESGKSCAVQQSGFDKELSKRSNLANDYFLERMCSGRYLGALCSIAIKKAAEEKLFSEDVCRSLLALEEMTSESVSLFLKEQDHTAPPFSSVLKGALSGDYIKLRLICESVFERAARLSAAVIAAACLKTGKGKTREKPVCITADGSTFLKGFLMKEKILFHLYTFLREEKDVHFTVVTHPDSVIMGTALSAFLQ